MRKFESHVVTTTGVSAATLDARSGFAQRLHACELGSAGRAFVKKTPDDCAAGERKVVGAFFVGEAEVAASLLPLRAVRLDAAFSHPVMGE